MLCRVTEGNEDGGSVDPTPLFRALREAQEHARSGRLHLVAARELRQLRFLGGAIADASSDVAGERLGDVLVRHGLLSQADLDGAVEVVLRERKRLGPVLAERGLLEEARIREGIGLHVREVVLSALDRAGLTVSFEELPEDEVEADFECPLSAAQLILDASRRVGIEHVSRAIALDGRVLVVAKDEPARARNVTLTTADGFILSQVDGTLRAADLASVIPLPREEFERSLFGLLSTGLVGFGEPKAPAAARARRKPTPAFDAVAPASPRAAGSSEPPAPAAPATASAPPPAASAPAPKSSGDLRLCIIEAYRGLERTHYEVLGIGQDASAADVRAAYARLMRTFHPDALRGPGLADVDEQREAVCLRAGDAYEVLRNEEARAAYDNNLKLWRRKVPAAPPAPPAPAPRSASTSPAAPPPPPSASAPGTPAAARAAAAPPAAAAVSPAPAAGAQAAGAASPVTTPTAAAAADPHAADEATPTPSLRPSPRPRS